MLMLKTPDGRILKLNRLNQVLIEWDSPDRVFVSILKKRKVCQQLAPVTLIEASSVLALAIH